MSPVGFLELNSDGYALKSIRYVFERKDSKSTIPEILVRTEKQLREYFEGRRFKFDLDINPDGTSFQQQVWRLIEKVEYGKTKCYNDLALELGSAGYSRAVGLANGRNPLPIIIPCHRIIGINGKLVGYSGGLERKKWLLVHEQKYSGNSLFF